MHAVLGNYIICYILYITTRILCRRFLYHNIATNNALIGDVFPA